MDAEDVERIRLWNKNFIPSVAKFAFEQAEKRLADLLEIRRACEQKLLSLFSVYISAAMAMFGIGTALFQNVGIASKAVWFFVPGAVFLVGALIIAYALWPQQGIMMGAIPSSTLTRAAEASDSEKEDAAQVAKIYAVHAYDLSISFELQIKSNAILQNALRIALVFGFGSAICFGIMLRLVFV